MTSIPGYCISRGIRIQKLLIFSGETTGLPTTGLPQPVDMPADFCSSAIFTVSSLPFLLDSRVYCFCFVYII